MKYRAIIFDLNGTIVTSPTRDGARRALLHTLGITLSEAEIAQLYAALEQVTSINQKCHIIHRMTPHHSVDHIERAWAGFYSGDATVLVEGFTTFHERVRACKLDTAIATNASHTLVHAIDQKVQLKKFFGNRIASADDVGGLTKPYPDIYLHAANKLGVLPEHCIAIEDSGRGVTAAKDAGMVCIALNLNDCHNEVAHADFVVTHYDEIDLDTLLDTQTS